MVRRRMGRKGEVEGRKGNEGGQEGVVMEGGMVTSPASAAEGSVGLGLRGWCL